jgi:hypothetical protein
MMFEGKKTYLAGGGLIVMGVIGFALTTFAPDVAATSGVHVDLQGLATYVLNGLAAIGLRFALPKAQ